MATGVFVDRMVTKVVPADSPEAAYQISEAEAIRLGLLPGPEAKHIPAPPEDKMLRRRSTKARR